MKTKLFLIRGHLSAAATHAAFVADPSRDLFVRAGSAVAAFAAWKLHYDGRKLPVTVTVTDTDQLPLNTAVGAIDWASLKQTVFTV